MVHQKVTVRLADIADVLGRVVDALCDFLIRCILAESQAQQMTIPGIADVLFNGVTHIAVPIVWHKITSKRQNAATVP